MHIDVLRSDIYYFGPLDEYSRIRGYSMERRRLPWLADLPTTWEIPHLLATDAEMAAYVKAACEVLTNYAGPWAEWGRRIVNSHNRLTVSGIGIPDYVGWAPIKEGADPLQVEAYAALLAVGAEVTPPKVERRYPVYEPIQAGILDCVYNVERARAVREWQAAPITEQEVVGRISSVTRRLTDEILAIRRKCRIIPVFLERGDRVVGPLPAGTITRHPQVARDDGVWVVLSGAEKDFDWRAVEMLRAAGCPQLVAALRMGGTYEELLEARSGFRRAHLDGHGPSVADVAHFHGAWIVPASGGSRIEWGAACKGRIISPREAVFSAAPPKSFIHHAAVCGCKVYLEDSR